MNNLWCVLLFFFVANVTSSKKYVSKYQISISNETEFNQPHFWTSSGFCPPDPHQDSYKFLLAPDMKQNLFLIGSLPYGSIQQIRVHWLLDLVNISVSPDFTVRYNFEYLDKFIYVLWESGLKPGFELMGNPSNYFTDFENTTQVYIWRDLIFKLANHYIDLFGKDYVREWNFETWNEPDHHDFDNLNFTIRGFLNYYDACSEGLLLADENLVFGGPGGSCRIPSMGHSPICWSLLDHCIRGKNFFTGEVGVRLNFISFHKKGNGSSYAILNDGFETIEYIQLKYPTLANVPFYNDEADPLKNWYRPQPWRADSYYAAMVVKVVLNHIYFYSKHNSHSENQRINFNLLSNDNAFLSYFPYQFSERTLLARFQINNTNPKYVDFVKKPVYAVFGLLKKMCPGILFLTIAKQGFPLSEKDPFGAIATKCEFDTYNVINILLYNSADTVRLNSTADVSISLNISQHFNSTPRWISMEVNNHKTNPYLEWQKQGSPAFPTAKDFSAIKSREEPFVKKPVAVTRDPNYEINLRVPNPGIVLISICEKNNLKEVGKIRFLQIRNQTLQISWLDKQNVCILTYNVFYSTYLEGPYRKINRRRIPFPSFWHDCSDNQCEIEGYYKVAAQNYWNENSPYSEYYHFKQQ